MIIRYSFVEDVMINIPNNVVWGMNVHLDSKGMDEGLYLMMNNTEYLITETDELCQGRPNLPDYAVSDLYSSIIDEISKMIIEKKPDLVCLDINDIEGHLLEEKYISQWVEKGYIELDEEGNW